MPMKHLHAALYFGIALLTAGCLASAAEKKAAPSPTPKPALPKSMSLDDCVRLSLAQNPNILAAESQIEATQGQIISIRAQALPHLSLTSFYNQNSKELLADTNGAAQEKTWDIAIQATQLVYSGGQVSAAIKIAKLTNTSSIYSLRNTIDLVILAVRQEFYELLLNRALIKVQEESVQVLQSQLKDQQNRFAAGTVPQFNVLQAEVALANQIPLLIKAKNQYLISQFTLAKTMGIQYNIWHPGKSAVQVIGDLTVNERSVDDQMAIEASKERRPSLQVQRQNILIQLQQIKVALAGYQPQISVSGGWKIRNSFQTSALDDTVNGWFFGASGDWAIFDGLQTYGNVKTARANLETAKTNYDEAVLQVELEVQRSIADMREAWQTILSQTKSVEQANEALRLSRERLDAGAGTQLDVLNAQLALAQARTNELQAQRDYNVAVAQLDYSTAADTKYEALFKDPLTRKKNAASKPTPTPKPKS